MRLVLISAFYCPTCVRLTARISDWRVGNPRFADGACKLVASLHVVIRMLRSNISALVDIVIVSALPIGITLAAYAPRFGISPHVVLWPILAAGLAAILVRSQLVAAGTPYPFAALRNGFKSQAFRTAFPLWISSRAAVLLVGYLAVASLGVDPRHVRFRVSRNEFWNLPARYDAGWYLGIARRGYEWDPIGFVRQQDIAFFPAHPVIMRFAAQLVTLPAYLFDRPELFGGGDARFLWGGVAISLLSFLGGLIYLYRLARLDLSHEQSRNALLLLTAYPFALFFSAPYSEGLYLLAVTGAFFHFRHGRYVVSGAWGLLAGLTRSNGFLLSVVLIIAMLSRWKPPDRRRDRAARAIAAALMPVLAMLLYSTFVYSVSGRPFGWAEAQQAWGRTMDVTAFVGHRWAKLQASGIDYVTREPVDLLTVVGTLLAFVSIPFVATRFSLAYATFVGLNVIVPFLLDLPAIGRMTSVMFPIFLWIASALPARMAPGLAAIFAIGQAVCAAVFFTWGPLM